MEVTPTPEQEAFIRDAIAAGRLHRPEEALSEALSLWAQRERRRAEILAAVDSADASLAQGHGRRVQSREETAELAVDVKRRGMARLAAEQNERG
jgi:Arc/MetJ-type ribon-helix-helix transcriptional regulator